MSITRHARTVVGNIARSWKHVDTTTTDSGALCLLYDRAREDR